MAYTPESLREIANSQDLFVWEMPEHEVRERTPKWYLIVSLIALASVIYGVLAQNYLFALIILFCAVILIMAKNSEPENILVQIGHNGVVVNGTFIEFDKFDHFAIVYHPPLTKVLYLERKLSFKPRIKLYLEDEDPIAIRNHLKKYLPENLELREEHISDIVGRLLRI
jgi:hypothetical protein